MSVTDWLKHKVPWLSLLGFACIYAFPPMLFASTSEAVRPLEGYGAYTFYSVQILAFVVFALASRTQESIMQEFRTAVIAAVITAVGTIFVFATYFAGTFALITFMIGSFLAATGSAFLYLYWIDLYAKVPIRRMVLLLVVVTLVSACLQALFVGSMNFYFGLIGITACPLLSVAMLALLRRFDLEDIANDGETVSYQWSFPLKPTILYGTFVFAYKVSLNLLPESDKITSIALGSFAGAVMVALVLLTKRKTFVSGSLFKASLPWMILGLLLTIEMHSASPLFGVISIVCARTIFTIFIIVALANLCFRNGISVFWLFGIIDAIARLASLSANWFTESIFVMPTEAEVYLFGLILITVVLCVFLSIVPDDSVGESWGMKKKDAIRQATVLDEVSALQRTARAHNLTLREEEIALLRLRDRTVAQIANELFVSQATVKSHINRIYKKTKTHSVEELAELVESFRT